MVSLIIPFYNDYKNFPALIDSLEGQVLKPDEIIVVDDYSYDPLRINGENELDIRIIRNGMNRGPAYSRNAGIRAAGGDILVFLDSDCIPPCDWIKKIVGCFNDRNINIVAGEAVVKNSEGMSKIISLLGYPAGGGLGFENMWPVDEKKRTNHISSCNFAIRKNIIMKHDLYFDEKFHLAGCEDVYYSLRCLESGESIYFFKGNEVIHSPEKNIFTFLRRHFIRGRASYRLQKNNVKILPYLFLRMKSLGSSLEMADALYEKIVIVVLYILMSIFQLTGNIFERIRVWFPYSFPVLISALFINSCSYEPHCNYMDGVMHLYGGKYESPGRWRPIYRRGVDFEMKLKEKCAHNSMKDCYLYGALKGGGSGKADLKLISRSCDSGFQKACRFLVDYREENNGSDTDEIMRKLCQKGYGYSCFIWTMRKWSNDGYNGILLNEIANSCVVRDELYCYFWYLIIKKIQKRRECLTEFSEECIFPDYLKRRKNRGNINRKYAEKLCEYGSKIGCLSVGLIQKAMGNREKAKELFLSACRSGYLQGCHLFAFAEESSGTSDRTFIETYRRNCNNGFFKSCYDLGLFEEFYGDKKSAMALYKKACRRGYKYACRNIRRLIHYER